MLIKMTTSERLVTVLFIVVCQGLFGTSQWIDASRYDSVYPRCDTSRSYNDRTREIDFRDEYLQRDVCLFITPPEGSGVLTVSFIMFNFGYEDEQGNCTNFVEIGTGDMKDTRKRFCGTRVPPPFISESGTAWIWIHTDSFSIYRSDIRIHYTTVSCGGEVVVPLYTFISSPNYPGLAPEDTSCEWAVSLHDTVSHRQMQVQMNLWEANYDTSLAIYDGTDKSARLLASFDQNTDPGIALNDMVTTSGPHAYIVFKGGVYFSRVKARFNATIKVKGYCLPGTISCNDGGSCYTAQQLCDGHQDCSTGNDEMGCGGCPPDEFWCGSQSHDCYSSAEKCNGVQNCKANMADEADCSCGSEVLVPLYAFVTSPNYHGHAAGGDTSCEWAVSLHDTVSHKQMQVQMNFWEANYGMSVAIYDSNNKNARLLASFDRSMEPDIVMKEVVTTSGPHAYIVFKRGVYFSSANAGFNATVKVKGYCLPGTLSCSDGESCYTAEQSCDGHQDCSTGYDEQGCKGCPPEEFWCGSHDHICYTSAEKCNGMKNCQTNMADEVNCKSCGPGSFLCAADSRCIFERWRCDGDFDCTDRSDEEGCHYTVSRRVITAATIGSLVCCLLLVIALGCTCKLYSLRAAHHRHPHHHYRATPLTRVEREIFQRQAPPTYDMTIDGVSAEPAPRPTRTQRQRRHRNRRYQFQRAMPASASDPAAGSRDEGTEERSLPPTPQPGSFVQSTSPSTTTPSEIDQNANANLRQSVASFMLESVPDILAELLFASRQNADNAGREAATPTSSTPRTSTPVPIETRDSGTQTNQNARNDRAATTPLVPAQSNSRASSSVQRRSGRTSSRSRSRSRRSGRVGGANSNAREQQAKPLPKKKKIMPVMVPAPCPDGVVEDTLTCVYPLPPSYSQAVRSGSVGGADATGGTSVADTSGSSLGSSFEETGAGGGATSAAASRSPVTSSPKNSKSKFSLPFSIGQAIRNIATSPFSKFQRNPYVQMDNPNASPDVVAVEDNVSVDGQSVFRPRVDRPSLTSSDDDLIDCAAGVEGAGSRNAITEPNQSPDAAITPLVKVFPKKQETVDLPESGPIAPHLQARSDRDSLELSDFSFSDAV